MAGSNPQKLPVCINVFATLDYIELVQLNDETRDIQLTASIPCRFDPTTRQLIDIELLTQGIKDLFNSNRIPFSTPVVVVLPSLLTREFDVPADLNRDELMMMATSEAERFNIFKNLETHLDILKLSSGQYVYSAYPKTEIEKLQMVFNELKINLKAIEINYFSIMRGLLATGTIAEEAASQDPWGLMVINENTFFISILEGLQFLTLSETLLSQNIERNDLLSEIKDDYDSFTRHKGFVKLVVVNNNTRLTTDEVLSHLNLDIPVANIDQKAVNLISRGASEGSLPCTLESIGGVFLPEIKELPSLNLKPRGGLNIESIDELRRKSFYIGMALCGVIFILLLFCWGLLALLVNLKMEEVKTLTAQQSESSPVKDANKFAEVQRKLFIKKARNQNILLNNTMVNIGKAIDRDSWVNKLALTNPLTESSDEETLPINILMDGASLSTDKLNAFTTQLNTLLKRNDLNVPKIDSEKKGEESFWVWTMESKANDPQSEGDGPGKAQ
ncbi:MAG: hypothetical protein VKJ04_04450 [Vampirovibrionales bacterium]|nr:hypothetical protein [Vampirovibrionales bacterium]